METSQLNGLQLMLMYHGAVRKRLRTLRELEAGLGSLDEDLRHEARENAREIVRFIETEHPLHERDEALSFFPRLVAAMQAAGEQDGEVWREVIEAKEEHDDFGRVWAPLEHWLCLLSTPDAIVSVDRLRDAISALEGFILEHFDREERALVPAAKRLLSDADFDAMGREINERHGWAS